jgi:hypothetical protein
MPITIQAAGAGVGMGAALSRVAERIVRNIGTFMVNVELENRSKV